MMAVQSGPLACPFASSPDTLPLEYPAQPNPPPRPTCKDDRIRLAAVNSIVDEVIDWLGDDWKGNSNRDELIADLLLVINERDGYRAARELETRRGWIGADENLVEILAGLPSALMNATDAAVREWVKANGIRPKLNVGDVVGTPDGSGPIMLIEPGRGIYAVQTESYRQRWGERGRFGTHYAYEQCAPVADADAA